MSGRFGYRFRLEKKIGAMTETAFIDPKSYLAIFLASRSTSVNSRPHSLPSTNAGHLLSSMVVPSSNTNEQSVCNIDDKCRFGYSSRKARPKSDLPADRSPPTASDNPELGQRRRRREEKVLGETEVIIARNLSLAYLRSCPAGGSGVSPVSRRFRCLISLPVGVSKGH